MWQHCWAFPETTYNSALSTAVNFPYSSPTRTTAQLYLSERVLLFYVASPFTRRRTCLQVAEEGDTVEMGWISTSAMVEELQAAKKDRPSTFDVWTRANHWPWRQQHSTVRDSALWSQLAVDMQKKCVRDTSREHVLPLLWERVEVIYVAEDVCCKCCRCEDGRRTALSGNYQLQIH